MYSFLADLTGYCSIVSYGPCLGTPAAAAGLDMVVSVVRYIELYLSDGMN